MTNKVSPNELYKKLCDLNLENQIGAISFDMAGVSVKINTTDTVGITLQAWLKQYLINNNYYFSEPANTQEFPDFFLDDNNPYEHMLEVKAFNYNATPAFDIANFESYCSSLKEKPFRLDADYIIFGYIMSTDGNISVKKLWLHKIWQISGTSQRYPLKTQIKRNMIYNIRPNSNFKKGTSGPFTSKEDFVKAIYDTLTDYKGSYFAQDWKNTLNQNYKNYYNCSLPF